MACGSAGMAGLAAWVQVGGTLATVSGAAVADAYDEPSTTISSLTGMREVPRDRIAIMSQDDINTLQPHPLPSQNGTATFVKPYGPLSFTAAGVVGKVAPSTTSTTAGTGNRTAALVNLATFLDGTPAITSSTNNTYVGKGRAIHFLWLPGVSYWYSQDCPGGRCGGVGVVPRDTGIRKIIAGVATLAGVEPPVAASKPSIETPLMLTPDGRSAVVTLLNFGPASCSWPHGQTQPPVCQTPPVAALSLNITIPFRPSAVSSVEHGQLNFTVQPHEGRAAAADSSASKYTVSLTALPLQHADFVLLESFVEPSESSESSLN